MVELQSVELVRSRNFRVMPDMRVVDCLGGGFALSKKPMKMPNLELLVQFYIGFTDELHEYSLTFLIQWSLQDVETLEPCRFDVCRSYDCGREFGGHRCDRVPPL